MHIYHTPIVNVLFTHDCFLLLRLFAQYDKKKIFKLAIYLFLKHSFYHIYNKYSIFWEIAIEVKKKKVGHVFIQTKFCCVGWGGNKILFWTTNMTKYFLFYVNIAISKRCGWYFPRYFRDKDWNLSFILLTTRKR